MGTHPNVIPEGPQAKRRICVGSLEEGKGGLLIFRKQKEPEQKGSRRSEVRELSSVIGKRKEVWGTRHHSAPKVGKEMTDKIIARGGQSLPWESNGRGR